MNWREFVEWTDETAVKKGDDLRGLQAGLIEEVHEALAAWHAYQAKEHGAMKRLYRGDEPSPNLVVDKARLRQKLVEEVGDAAWYAARIVRVRGERTENPGQGVAELGSLDAVMEFLSPESFSSPGHWAIWMLSNLLALTGVGLQSAIDGNVDKLLARKAAGTIMGSGDR